MKRLLGAILAVLAGLAYLATGVHIVSPGEVLVVRRLGRVLAHPWSQGPHWGYPIGFDRVTRVRIEEVRRLDVGLVGTPGPADDPGSGELLTGDLNLLRARAVVQYRVTDPIAFVLRVRDRNRLFPRLAEASLTSALARRRVDEALREGRALVARDVQSELTHRVSSYGLGVVILGVSLTEVRPPPEVQADFAAAQAAQSEHDRRLTEARTYAGTARHAARAKAQAKLDSAHARADRAVLLARSGVSRFLAILEEADRSRALTVRRIYLDALRDLLPRVRRKVVLTPDEPVDLSIFGRDK